MVLYPINSFSYIVVSQGRRTRHEITEEYHRGVFAGCLQAACKHFECSGEVIGRTRPRVSDQQHLVGEVGTVRPLGCRRRIGQLRHEWRTGPKWDHEEEAG